MQPTYRHSVSECYLSYIIELRDILTNIRVHPVAHGGMDAKIGAKKIEIRKHSPVVIEVNPVLPPSAMPAPLSIKAVTGEHPKSEAREMHDASVQ